VRGTTQDLEVMGEFLYLISMQVRTTGQTSPMLPCLLLIGFELSMLVSVTTDSVPATFGSTKELSQLVIDHSLCCTQEIDKVLCIVHQVSLRSKAAGIKDITFAVVKLVNSDCSSPQPPHLKQVREADYSELLYHTQHQKAQS